LGDLVVQPRGDGRHLPGERVQLSRLTVQSGKDGGQLRGDGCKVRLDPAEVVGQVVDPLFQL
jgi:hypothetical protein